jgi:hypothetical protein
LIYERVRVRVMKGAVIFAPNPYIEEMLVEDATVSPNLNATSLN